MMKPTMKTIFICLLLFLLFLLIRFPFQNLRGHIFKKIYDTTGIFIVADDIYLSLFGWPGVGMKNVEAAIPLGEKGGGTEMDLSSKKMVFRVGLAGLFPPTLSISLEAKQLRKGGDVFFKFSQQKGLLNAYLEGEDVMIEQFFSQKDQAVLGVLTTEGSVNYDEKDVAKSQGRMEITLDKLKTPGQNYQGVILPAINFGSLKSKLQIRNGMVEINSFQFGNPESDLQGSISGDIKLGKTIASSFLNLTLKIQMKDAFRDHPSSQTLVSLLNGIDNSKPGTYAMKWATTIEGITTNLWNALPKKVSY